MVNETALSLDSYIRLFEPYESQLKEFDGREREYGGRFALLFRQVTRLLVKDDDFNHRLPKLYRSIAFRYLDNETDTVSYFSYEDNRHSFLSELLDWLRVHQRGEALRRMNV